MTETLTPFTPVTFNDRLTPCIIVDIDGTIADNSHRSPYEYENLSEDTPIDKTREVIIAMSEHMLTDNKNIIFSTGRPESVREETTLWLSGVFWWLHPDEIKLFMRPTDDARQDTLVKRENLEKISQIYYPLLALEDRNRCVQMYRESGLTCYQVTDGNY